MFELTKLENKSGNEMIRIGFGRHNKKWFLRVDLWSIGYRVTVKDKNSDTVIDETEYQKLFWSQLYPQLHTRNRLEMKLYRDRLSKGRVPINFWELVVNEANDLISKQ